MSKKGSPTLRATLYMVSVACIKHNRELRSLYLKKISQGKEAKQALVCVGKKLACINVQYAQKRNLIRSPQGLHPSLRKIKL